MDITLKLIKKLEKLGVSLTPIGEIFGISEEILTLDANTIETKLNYMKSEKYKYELTEKFKKSGYEFLEFVGITTGIVFDIQKITAKINDFLDSIKPATNTASDIAGCVFNPGLIPKIAQDIALQILGLLLANLGIIISFIIKLFMMIPLKSKTKLDFNDKKSVEKFLAEIEKPNFTDEIIRPKTKTVFTTEIETLSSSSSNKPEQKDFIDYSKINPFGADAILGEQVVNGDSCELLKCSI